MAVEPKRGCGFRKVGGLYLVCDGAGWPCGRLPLPLTVCPTCGAGIKQSRGWTWVDPGELFDAAAGCEWPEAVDTSSGWRGCGNCPLADPRQTMGERAGLLWIGEKFYASPLEFEVEAGKLGISRRIAAVPHEFELGKTWVLLAHPKAITSQQTILEGRGAAEPGPGVFSVFKPQRIEKIVTETEAADAEAMAVLERRGITPIAVPDGDEDHAP